jgi:hypothetical protein
VCQGRLGVAMREGFSASPDVVNGKVFFTNEEGETFVLKAGSTFELLHVSRLNAQALASRLRGPPKTRCNPLIPQGRGSLMAAG